MSVSIVRRSRLRWLVLLFGLSLLGCGDPKSPPPTPSVGSNSNWLKACEADGECSENRFCRCGTCTIDCSDDAACGVLPQAQCALGADFAVVATCGVELASSIGGLCLPRCEAGSCGEGQACVEGSCVLAPMPAGDYCAPVAESSATQREREDQLLALVLEARAGGGVICGSEAPSAPTTSLRLEPRLHCAARLLAVATNEQGSAAIDRTGNDTNDRLRAVGYEPVLWGESFAVRALSPEDALRLMRNDVDTCRRFSNPRFRDIGVGNADASYIVTLGVEQ